jgi:hypothetical protein
MRPLREWRSARGPSTPPSSTAGPTWATSRNARALGLLVRLATVAATASAYTQSPRLEMACADHSRMKPPRRRSGPNSFLGAGRSRDPPARCRVSAAPRTMQTSPMLKTFESGHDEGTAKMSPRKASRGASMTAVLLNPVGSRGRPAVARADGTTGITPPLAAIAVKFSSVPSPRSHRPGTRRFRTRKAKASTYVPRCTASRHSSRHSPSPSGII